MRSDGDAAPWPLLRGDALGAQRARPARRRDTSDSGEEEFSENAVGGCFCAFKKGFVCAFHCSLNADASLLNVACDTLKGLL